MILVVGATGILGSEICRRLRSRDLAVRAFVRAGSPKEAALRDIGVEIFEATSGRADRVKRLPRPMLTLLSPTVALFNEAAGSGMRLGAESAFGDIIDSPLQRELAVPLTSTQEYATRALRG